MVIELIKNRSSPSFMTDQKFPSASNVIVRCTFLFFHAEQTFATASFQIMFFKIGAALIPNPWNQYEKWQKK